MGILKVALLGLMSLLYLGAGADHFIHPETYLRAMPPYLPWPEPLLIIAGAAKIILGAAVLVPSIRTKAAWGIIALLIAVFPANVHMAMVPEAFPEMPLVALYCRLPMQAVLIAWAWWYTRATRIAEAAHSRPNS